MDCRYCDIQVEITKRAYAARCPNPVAVLEYIREKMKTSTRPRVDISDMKRSTPMPAPENTITLPDSEDDMLTSAAKAIGTTLGKLAVTAGIAKPPASEPASAPAPAPKARKKAAPKKKAVAKKSATKTAAKKKAAPKKSSRKSARP